MTRVMIVEDDPMVREINRKFVHQIPDFHVCATAATLTEAKRLMQEEEPELILLDLYLPQGNGLDFLKWLRKEEIECDVILITADKNVETVSEALRYGAMDYLIKPFTFTRLKEALDQYRVRKEGFGGAREVEQDTLDQYIFAAKREEREEVKTPKTVSSVKEGTLILPKGLNQQTYDLLWEALAKRAANLAEQALDTDEQGWEEQSAAGEGGKAKSFTAEDIAEQVGLARVTVRRYLEYMVEEGRLVVQMEYGKVGRPTHVYKMVVEK